MSNVRPHKNEPNVRALCSRLRYSCPTGRIRSRFSLEKAVQEELGLAFTRHIPFRLLFCIVGKFHRPRPSKFVREDRRVHQINVVQTVGRVRDIRHSDQPTRPLEEGSQ